ncbi:Protein angel 2 [Mortierella alpina]|nr:Protein angel 2 [Mortierella alpina]
MHPKRKSRLLSHLRLTELLQSEPHVRPWERIVHHSADHAFSVMTYNLLSSSVASTFSAKYMSFTPDPTDWTSRSDLLLQEIEAQNMDICCFQELDREDFRIVFKPRMKELGYDGFFQKRHDVLKHGCALFYRRVKVALVYRSHVCCDWFETPQFAGVLGIFDIDLGREKRYVCIGTTHLVHSGSKNIVKLGQVLALTAAAEALIKRNPSIPFRFADLTISAEKWFSKPVARGMQRYVTDWDLWKIAMFKRQTRHLRIRKALSPLLPTKGDALRDIIRNQMDKNDGVIQHSLRLSSVYHDVDSVDFIFYGQPDGSKARLEPVARLKIYDALLLHRVGLPAAHFGSDHYALGAQFRFV